MRKNYVSPYIMGKSLVMPQPILTGGSIDNMQYGTSNLFEDDEDDVKGRNEFGYEHEGIQNSLW